MLLIMSPPSSACILPLLVHSARAQFSTGPNSFANFTTKVVPATCTVTFAKTWTITIPRPPCSYRIQSQLTTATTTQAYNGTKPLDVTTSTFFVVDYEPECSTQPTTTTIPSLPSPTYPAGQCLSTTVTFTRTVFDGAASLMTIPYFASQTTSVGSLTGNAIGSAVPVTEPVLTLPIMSAKTDGDMSVIGPVTSQPLPNTPLPSAGLLMGRTSIPIPTASGSAISVETIGSFESSTFTTPGAELSFYISSTQVPTFSMPFMDIPSAGPVPLSSIANTDSLTTIPIMVPSDIPSTTPIQSSILPLPSVIQLLPPCRRPQP